MSRKRKLPDGMVTRPGRKGYYADFKVGGRRIQKKLGTDFDAAKSILTDLRARAERADFNLLDNNHPIADLRRQYIAHCKQALEASTVRCYEDWLDTILPALGVVKVSQLTIPAVVAYRERRLAKGRSPRTVNGEVGALATMLNWGVNLGKVIGSNPLAGLVPLPHDRPKEGRPLSDDEVPRLLKASAPHWRDVWYAFLVTGLRKSELASLQFTGEFLDWEAREVIVPPWLAKKGVLRRIPMDDELYAILKRLESGRADRKPGKGRGKVSAERVQARFSRDHIFVTTGNTPLTSRGNLRRALLTCLEKAGIERATYAPDGRLLEHVDIHSLRKTFATSLICSGADPKTVQELLGHKTLAMTMRIYAKVRGGTKRQAMARLPYGAGTSAPAHVVQMPARTLPVQSGEQSPATKESTPQTEVG
ncbi:MAG TPA: tyrosine-type recombinase/integrase [Gemmataceae bacterium]|nr:tyrosine-type recombinase/integrase [Gemmataceae bacterium]